jgi:hypothetical protein
VDVSDLFQASVNLSTLCVWLCHHSFPTFYLLSSTPTSPLVITLCLTLYPGLFLPLSDIPGVRHRLNFRHGSTDSVLVSEQSRIYQSSAIEGDGPELNLTFAAREDPSDEHMVPNLESGVDEAMESESASDYILQKVLL